MEIKWVSSSKVLKYLGISQRTLQNYRDKKIIPYTKIGNKFLYDINDINKILEKNKSKQPKLKVKAVESGIISLIMQTEKDRILQIGINNEQSNMLQSFLKDLSKISPLVQMNEDNDLVLKSSIK